MGQKNKYLCPVMFLHDRFYIKLNAVPRLNHEKCVGNTTNAAPIMHIWDLSESEGEIERNAERRKEIKKG